MPTVSIDIQNPICPPGPVLGLVDIFGVGFGSIFANFDFIVTIPVFMDDFSGLPTGAYKILICRYI